MSTFSDSWVACMNSSNFPVPSVDTVDEGLEFLHKLHSAWENAGADEEMTIGALIAAGALTGVDESALAVLGEVAQVAVLVYIGACVACMSSVALDRLKEMFSSNELPDYVVADLNNQGIDLTQGVAV